MKHLPLPKTQKFHHICTSATTLVVLLLATSTIPAVGAEIHVGPGQSIQAAVDRAEPGDQITVLPGTYHETGRPCPTAPSQTCAVVVSLDNITLAAQALPGRPVILENPGSQSTGIAFAKHGAIGAQCQNDPRQRLNGASVEGFIVRNFSQDGIFLFCADNWSVRFNAAVDNAEYGIFPSHCGHGRLSMNIASGSHDTGIYIGQSHDAHVDHNVAHDIDHAESPGPNSLMFFAGKENTKH